MMKSNSKAPKEDTRTTPKKWKVQETPHDASLFPTIAVTLWLGMYGLIASVFGYMLFYAPHSQKLLFSLVVISSLFSPRANNHDQHYNWFLIHLTHLFRCMLLWRAVELKAHIITGMLISLILPSQDPYGLGRKFGDIIMIESAKYFGLKTTLEDEEAIMQISRRDGGQGAAIFAFEPHDVLPFTVFALNPALKRIPGRVGETMGCLMTSAVFYTPFLRNIFTWICALPVSKKYFHERLEQGKSVVFVPGGVQEVMLMTSAKEQHEIALYLKKRTGFIKIALEHGSPIVPTFSFHLDESFGRYFPRGIEFIFRFARSVGFLPVFFWGRFHIPWGIPRPVKMHIVVGKPILVPKLGKYATKEKVDEYHKIYLKELESLFDRHKHGEGYGKCKLKIM